MAEVAVGRDRGRGGGGEREGAAGEEGDKWVRGKNGLLHLRSTKND